MLLVGGVNSDTIGLVCVIYPKDFSSSQNSGQWFDPQPKKLKSRHLGEAGKVSLEHLKHYWMVQRSAWHLEVWAGISSSSSESTMQICYRFDAKSRQVILFKQIILRATNNHSLFILGTWQPTTDQYSKKREWVKHGEIHMAKPALICECATGRMTVICSMPGKFIQHNSLCVCWSMFELRACMILNLV